MGRGRLSDNIERGGQIDLLYPFTSSFFSLFLIRRTNSW